MSLGQHESHLSTDECPEQSDRGGPELVIFAASKDRGVGVHARLHRPILAEVRTQRFSFFADLFGCPTECGSPAARIRLRPILMTTMAMIFGMLPLAFELGAGAEFRAPMARAVIGGLITSTLLTLVVVPVVYTYLDALGRRFERWWARKTPAEQPVEQPTSKAA